MKTPEFLTKGFQMYVNMWCVKENKINRHVVELVSHKDNYISFWKTCCDCQDAYEKLTRLGVDMEKPLKADRMPTAEWVFLYLQPEEVVR